jgi:hypothetical protein
MHRVPRLADAPPSLPSIHNLVWCIGIGGHVQRETADYLSILPHQRMVFVLDRILRDMTIQFLVEPYVTSNAKVVGKLIFPEQHHTPI